MFLRFSPRIYTVEEILVVAFLASQQKYQPTLYTVLQWQYSMRNIFINMKHQREALNKKCVA